MCNHTPAACSFFKQMSLLHQGACHLQYIRRWHLAEARIFGMMITTLWLVGRPVELTPVQSMVAILVDHFPAVDTLVLRVDRGSKANGFTSTERVWVKICSKE